MAAKRKEVKPRAIISVTDKTGVADLARGLVERGYEIVSTGGTYKHLREQGVKCLKIEAVTGVREFLDGRVKTINHKVAAGILAKRISDHLAQLRVRHIRTIDIVVCNLYEFAKAVASGKTHDEIIEAIDIGGIVLLRAAAKNYDQGLVVMSDPADYERLLEALRQGNGTIDEALRQEFATKVFLLTAMYDATIWQYLSGLNGHGGKALLLSPVRELRKPENGDQGKSVMSRNLMLPDDDPLAWHRWHFVAGNPGHVNLCGADSALRVMCRLAEACRRNFRQVPKIAIACKHGNPCGLGASFESSDEALELCMTGDGDAVMGSEIMVNFELSGEQAIRIHAVLERWRTKVGRNLWGADVICAPNYTEAAKTLLTLRANERHLLANPALSDPVMSKQDVEIRPIRGGALVQGAANFVLRFDEVKEMLGSPRFDRDAWLTVLIAWVVAWEGVSNSVVLAKNRQLIGTGLGQQDRRGAAKLALLRASDAGHDVSGSIIGSDGFFPFAEAAPDSNLPEAIEMLADAGCIGVVVPADGKRWQEVKAFIEKRGLIGVILDASHRGFAKH